ncbi:MAG: hypothetical protein P8L68_09145 [Paracoccaceae bacterium]|nr:hypothetical protein [Paracoccaceae bacterium]MDG2258643.1 hypothetical protein [Paracoccaceae bacterium]
MSFLVSYTLKDEADFDHQVAAMEELVADLKAAGIDGLDYSCFSTAEKTEFIGVLEFRDDTSKQGFLDSAAFDRYRAKVGPTFANPPQTRDIFAIGSTKA